MPELQGMVLDVDGTLVDSNDVHARSWVEAMGEHGFEVPFEKVRRLIGMGGDKLLPVVLQIEKDSDVGKALSERRGEIFKGRYLAGVRPFPGTKELLQTMHDRGLKLIVASSGEEDEVKALLEIAGVTGLIDTLASGSEAKKSKPDPATIEVALKKAGLPPDAVLMLGDTPFDIEAAGKAGVRTIAVRCGGFGDADFKDAVAIFDGPADLLARYDESPLA